MPETDPKPVDVPEVKDRRLKILGLVPKNAQARILGGIALLMVVIFTLSGRDTQRSRPASGQAPAVATVDPSQARIQEYRIRIEEQARKLAAEEAQLALTKQAMGLSPGGRVSGPESARSNEASMGASRSLYAPYSRELPESTWIETEKEKREYQAPFASNIALTYRKPVSSREAETEVAPPSSSANKAEDAAPEAAAPPSGKDRKQRPDHLNRAEGKERRLFEGTVIETVLTNRLDASFSGPVNCMVTTNVYSHDRQRLLIPQGTRVLGEVRKLESFGQQRLAVSFHRLIMPDGFSVSLDKFQGLNQIGETGLRDQVNHHYLQIFGVSLAIGAIAGFSQANTRYGLDQSAADAYRQGVANSLSQSSLHILDRYLNVLPTFTIRGGHRVKIYLSEDLVLPAYEAHEMPSDL